MRGQPEIIVNIPREKGFFVETSDYSEGGSNQLSELRSNLLQTQIALLRRPREPRVVKSDLPCQYRIDHAGAEATAAQAALDAGDLEACQKHLDAGFAWVAAGEACLELLKTLP
jgi:hypothetical protein